MSVGLFFRSLVERGEGPTAAVSKPAARRWQPMLEYLEDRTVPAHVLPAPGGADGAALTQNLAAALQADASAPIQFSLDFVRFAKQGNSLALIANLTMPDGDVRRLEIPITAHQEENGVCQILNLELGPIHLNLLGLNVDTSPICLNITADPEGGLLGDLLCDLAGGVVADGRVTGAEVRSLNNALRDIDPGALTLNGTLTPSADTEVGEDENGVCQILNLSLEIEDLNLLGLHVELNNCEEGPITVDITGDPEGGLLGRLLCSLADGGLDLGDLTDRLNDLLDRVLDQLDLLERVDKLFDRLEDRLDKLVDRLGDKLEERIDDLFTRLEDRIDDLFDDLEEEV